MVVVTHEEVIQEICRHADPTSSGRRKIPNTSISVFHVSGSDGHWILEKVGDIGHLNEDSFPQDAPGGDGGGISVTVCLPGVMNQDSISESTSRQRPSRIKKPSKRFYGPEWAK